VGARPTHGKCSLVSVRDFFNRPKTRWAFQEGSLECMKIGAIADRAVSEIQRKPEDTALMPRQHVSVDAFAWVSSPFHPISVDTEIFSFATLLVFIGVSWVG